MSVEDRQALSDLLNHRRVLICVGSGGVGKTTTSAVIGLHAALEGLKVLVLTIDPAKRLANSLGIDAIGHTRQQIPLEQFEAIGLEPRGELWAMMLDMKEAFDHLVRRDAPSEQAAEEILENPFYQYFSTSLAGTQEYAASERIYELRQEDYFDLIVLDTPPTTHALDFLDAPKRLSDAVGSRALQWMYKPGVLAGKPGRGLLSVGSNYVLRTLGKFTGGELLRDLTVFLKSFSVLFEGFDQRAQAVQKLLTSNETSFVVVTAPDTLTVEEALYFYEQLGDGSLEVDGFVVNRVHPRWVEGDLAAKAESLPANLQTLVELQPFQARQCAQGADREQETDLAALAALLHENATQFDIRAGQDSGSIEKMRLRLPPSMPIVQVPYFNQDIHSLRGLNRARQAIFDISEV